jgi:hypothetical protein
MNVVMHIIRVSLAVAIFAWLPQARADCEPFHDSLDSLESIAANGGVVSGTLGFAPAVNGQGVIFTGAGHVSYAGDLFAADSGSLSLWFSRNSTDAEGGIAQIGTLGQPNSLGIFYVAENDLVFEMRNAAGELVQISAAGVLAQNSWTHIVAIWRHLGEGCDLWLFVNGFYTSYGWLSGALELGPAQLQLGVTGYYGYAEGVADELRFFDWRLRDDEVYAEYVYSASRFQRQPTGKPVSTGPVRIVDGSLTVDGRPFRVKGVGYAPTPIHAWPSAATYSDPAILGRDMPLLRAMNVNTIRTWAQPADTALLDACYNGGVDPIRVIVGFWVPLHEGVDYSDPATIAAIESDFAACVNRFKDHPALLAWGIGNENNFAYHGDVADWYLLANDLAGLAYALEGESYHPTLVVNAGMLHFGDVALGSDDASLSNVDMWGHNAYPGEDFHCYFDYYERLSAKPLVLTEYGIDAYDNASGGEYQTVQAEYVVRQWRQIEATAAGGTVMAYSDEWWKAGDPDSHNLGGYATPMHPDGYSNEEWWGMLGAEDNGGGPDILHPRQVYFSLAAEYADVNGDYDLDDDTDLRDAGALQTCFGEPAAGACGAAFEFTADGWVDFDDFSRFTECLNGPARLPACAE